MKSKDYSDYLQDIFDSINDTDDFVRGISFEAFLKDKKSVNYMGSYKNRLAIHKTFDYRSYRQT